MATVNVNASETFVFSEGLGDRLNFDIDVAENFTVTERASVIPSDPALWPFTAPTDAR